MSTIALQQSVVQGQTLRRAALFVAILLSGGNEIFPRVPLAIALIMLCVAIQGIRILTRREFAFCLVLLITILAVAIFQGDQILSTAILVRFTNFLLALMVLSLYLDIGRDVFIDDIFPILKLMCYQAIATTVLGTLVPGLFFPLYVKESTYNTLGLIFTFHAGAEGAGAIARADGFFFEPGVFQLYLNIFVIISAFIRKNVKNLALGVAAVIATQSTTGLSITGILLIVFLFRRVKEMPTYFNVMTSVFSPILIIPFAFLLSSNVEDKFFGVARGSSWAREYDLYTGLAVARENPWFGIGFDYKRYFEESYFLGYKGTLLDDNSIIDRPNSNGIVIALYTLGIPLALIFFIGLYRQLLIEERALMFLTMFLSFSTEAMLFTPFALMFVFSGLLIRSKK